MDSSLNIVVVEDHASLRRVMVQVLSDHGHRVVGLSCAEEVEDGIGDWVPDIYILDLNLPGEDGLSLSRRLRQSHPRAGIIMATTRDEVADKVRGYDSGADIYLPKPVDVNELLAAARGLARRLVSAAPMQMPEAVANIVVNLQALHLKGPVGEAALSHAEVTLLSALARAPGQTLERWQVAQNLGQEVVELSKSGLEMRIGRLRKKLVQVSGSSAPLKAVRNQGYKLCIPLSLV